MATALRQSPSKGSRVLVKLPFAALKTGGGEKAGQLISIKQGVAKLLGFKPLTKAPTVKVKFKTAKGTATVTRLLQGSYKRRSVKLIFATPQVIIGSRGKFKSVSLPLCSGATIAGAVAYFQVGAGKDKKVIALVTPDGKRIQWDNAVLSQVK